MSADSPVTLRQTTYRGAAAFQLTWTEEGAAKEKQFASEAEAVVEMAAIEERLKLAEMAGKGLTVNPFGALTPFISSKDVHFAALRLQPRGLSFRTAIDDYVAAVLALKGCDVGVPEAAKGYAEASALLKPFEVSVGQAVFEWVEFKKQIGDRPLFDVLKAYLKQAAASGSTPGRAEAESTKVAPSSG